MSFGALIRELNNLNKSAGKKFEQNLRQGDEDVAAMFGVGDGDASELMLGLVGGTTTPQVSFKRLPLKPGANLDQFRRQLELMDTVDLSNAAKFNRAVGQTKSGKHNLGNIGRVGDDLLRRLNLDNTMTSKTAKKNLERVLDMFDRLGLTPSDVEDIGKQVDEMPNLTQLRNQRLKAQQQGKLRPLNF